MLLLPFPKPLPRYCGAIEVILRPAILQFPRLVDTVDLVPQLPEMRKPLLCRAHIYYTPCEIVLQPTQANALLYGSFRIQQGQTCTNTDYSVG